MAIKLIETLILLFGGFIVGWYLTRTYYTKIVQRLNQTIQYNIRGIKIRDNKIKDYREQIESLEKINHQLITENKTENKENDLQMQ